MNYKPFSIKMKVKSEDAKKVMVKFFLAPKYDSMGLEIPLQRNTENFFLMEQFPYDCEYHFRSSCPHVLWRYNYVNIPIRYVWINTCNSFFLLVTVPAGESVIVRNSSDFVFAFKKTMTTWEIAEEVLSGNWKPYSSSMSVFPDHLMLPKGMYSYVFSTSRDNNSNSFG